MKQSDQENEKELLEYPPVTETPTHTFTDEQLRQFDFGALPLQERALLERLSFFSPQKNMYQILINELGEARAKQKFISSNFPFLNPEQLAVFHRNSESYMNATIRYPVAITLASTLSAFLIGLWRLPSRKSTSKYIMAGFTTGIVVSYGVWRYTMFNYYQKLNRQLRMIIKEKYLSDK